MPYFISENQSASILDRLITDNILLVHELHHTMTNKRQGRLGQMAVKVDISKASDRMEWVYLEVVMKRMGFHGQWVNLVMLCTTTIFYSMLVNGNLGPSILPWRGLRQGDPLSPYLFLFCEEGFSSMVNQAKIKGEIRGAIVIRGRISINHFLFTNDCILFSKASSQELFQLQSLLDAYEKA